MSLLGENIEKVSCETPTQTIQRLQDENYKLNEEVKNLLNQLLERENMIGHIKMAVDLISNKVKSEYR